MFCHKIYSYYANFFFFLSFSIILKSYNDRLLVIVLFFFVFHFTSYSTTQKHEIHQQMKKEGKGGVDCKYFITYKQWCTILLIQNPLPTHVFFFLIIINHHILFYLSYFTHTHTEPSKTTHCHKAGLTTIAMEYRICYTSIRLLYNNT